MHQAGHARTSDQAIRAAINYLRKEIRSPYRDRNPLRWDDTPELLANGTISRDQRQYGKLWCQDVAEWWLSRQIPAWWDWISASGIEIERTEHQIFVPMRPDPNWKHAWHFEARLDLECKDQDGPLILDVKTTTTPWSAQDLRKARMQAQLYMAAYRRHYGVTPRFFYLVLPRYWDPETKAATTRIHTHQIEYDALEAQRLVAGVVRPKIDQIEAGSFAANPYTPLCNEKYCAWHHLCLFGAGDQLPQSGR